MTTQQAGNANNDPSASERLVAEERAVSSIVVSSLGGVSIGVATPMAIAVAVEHATDNDNIPPSAEVPLAASAVVLIPLGAAAFVSALRNLRR